MRRCDATLGFLLKTMKDVHSPFQFYRLNATICPSVEIGDDFDTVAQRLGVDVPSSVLCLSQPKADHPLHVEGEL